MTRRRPKAISPQFITGLKVLIHLVSLGFLASLVIQVNNDQLGGDPVQGIIHYTGISALNTLFISMLISPVARWTKQGLLVRVRRVLGLYSFMWAVLHFAAYAIFDLGLDWGLLASELIKRPYLTIGALSWVILFALSITSFKAIQRRMGVKWQKLHNGVYLIVILTPIHYYWSVKSEIAEPALYLIFAIGLLAMRWKILKKRLSR